MIKIGFIIIYLNHSNDNIDNSNNMNHNYSLRLLHLKLFHLKEHQYSANYLQCVQKLYYQCALPLLPLQFGQSLWRS